MAAETAQPKLRMFFRCPSGMQTSERVQQNNYSRKWEAETLIVHHLLKAGRAMSTDILAFPTWVGCWLSTQQAHSGIEVRDYEAVPLALAKLITTAIGRLHQVPRIACAGTISICPLLSLSIPTE